MQSICVYLGAKSGNDQRLSFAAESLGDAIAKAGYRLVYGGSSKGLMGTLAKAAMNRGGKVTGICPKQLLEQEQPFTTLDKLIITDSMQERKRLLENHADAFIVMPGGLGTLEEAFETWNAIKLGIIHKYIGFLNLGGYFDGLFSFLENCIKNGFMSTGDIKIPVINADPCLLLAELARLSSKMTNGKETAYST